MNGMLHKGVSARRAWVECMDWKWNWRLRGSQIFPGVQVGSQAACKAWGTAWFLWKPSVCSLRGGSVRHGINAGRAGREVLQHRKQKHSLKQIKKMVINQMNFILEIIR